MILDRTGWEVIDKCLLCGPGKIVLGENEEFRLETIALHPTYKVENKTISIYIDGESYGEWLEAQAVSFLKVSCPLHFKAEMDITLYFNGDVYLCGKLARYCPKYDSLANKLTKALQTRQHILDGMEESNK